jgi:hypothetical protein
VDLRFERTTTGRLKVKTRKPNSVEVDIEEDQQPRQAA